MAWISLVREQVSIVATWREGGREGGRDRGREGGREGGRDRGREGGGGRETIRNLVTHVRAVPCCSQS